MGQQPNCSPINPADFQFSCTVLAEVFLRGELLDYPGNQAALFQGGETEVKMLIEDRWVEAGENVEVKVYGEGMEAMSGYQFTLHTRGLEYQGIDEDGIGNSWCAVLHFGPGGLQCQ